MHVLAMAALLAVFSGSVYAQGCVDSTDRNIVIIENGRRFELPILANYTANIAKRDLYNSRGVRLDSFTAVLQQDRANVHHTGRTDGPYEDIDSYFTSLARRAELARATYYMDCNLSVAGEQAVKESILYGRVAGLVWVLAFRRPMGDLGVYISLAN